jgi:hypothetical protein
MVVQRLQHAKGVEASDGKGADCDKDKERLTLSLGFARLLAAAGQKTRAGICFVRKGNRFLREGNPFLGNGFPFLSGICFIDGFSLATVNGEQNAQ